MAVFACQTRSNALLALSDLLDMPHGVSTPSPCRSDRRGSASSPSTQSSPA